MDDTQQFYDGLSGDYHLIFADWAASVERQAGVLDSLLQRHARSGVERVLDCACGIGTQAIGLARRGYTVRATDLSPQSVERAQQEAARLGLDMTFGVADMRTLDQQVDGRYDAIIACDNALPHLMTDADLLAAAQAMRRKTRPGGLLLATIRDYDILLEERPRVTPPAVYDRDAGRSIVFQVWDWAEDGSQYDLTMYVISETDGDRDLRAYPARYRALRRADLTRIISEAGWQDVLWLEPEESGYYQPVVIAYCPQT